MTGLPDGWRRMTMGEVCQVVSGSTPRTSVTENWGGDIPWITPDDLSRHRAKVIREGARSITRVGYDSCSTTMVPAGSVLYTTRAPIGYVAVAGQPVCTHQGFKNFVPGPDVWSDYLYWYLRFFTPQIREMGSGTTFKEVSKKVAKTIPLVLPPVDEQQRIVAAIEEQFSRLDAAVNYLEAAENRLGLFLKEVVARASSQGVEMTLGEALGRESLFSDGDWVESKDQDPEGEVRLIQLADIGDGVFRDRSNRFLNSATATKLGCTYLAQGDILIARMPEPLGRACVFPGVGRPAVTAVDVCIVRPSETAPDPQWLMHTINSKTFRRKVAALQSGTTRKRISRKNLASITLSVPDRGVQEALAPEIDRHLSLGRSLRTALETAKARSRLIHQAILGEAFEGRLVTTVEEAPVEVE